MNTNNFDLQYFKEVLLFFNEFQWLYNNSVTKILINESLNSFPKGWITALENLNNTNLNNFVTKLECQVDWPDSLIKFIEICKILDKLRNSPSINPTVKLPNLFKKNLNIKKQHEICRLAQLVHEECSKLNITTIVDMGSGLGYISQLLYHLFGYKVLGLENKIENVIKAKKRQKELFQDSINFVRYSCLDINSGSANIINDILRDEFKEEKQVCLTGLHACGDLSISMSKIYSQLEIARLLIVLPCCYHKLTLQSKDSIDDKEYFNYFPLSSNFNKVIKDLDLDIGKFLKRPFLRLACQETSDRWYDMPEETHIEHSFYVLARAVLELYAHKNNLKLKKLVSKGTRKSQCVSFESYLDDCIHRYKLEKIIDNEHTTIVPWSEEIKHEIITLWYNNKNLQNKLELYTGLQLILQHPVESLVLTDRLKFLNEQNYDCKIIHVMDRSLSPRSYAIVSRKK